MAEATISEFPEPARQDARRSFDGQLADVDRCDIVTDSALSGDASPSSRRIRFAGSLLSVGVTCDEPVAGHALVEVTNTATGRGCGPCRLTVLAEGRLDAVAVAATDDDGRASLALPARVVSVLVTGPERLGSPVAQTAWLRL